MSSPLPCLQQCTLGFATLQIQQKVDWLIMKVGVAHWHTARVLKFKWEVLIKCNMLLLQRITLEVSSRLPSKSQGFLYSSEPRSQQITIKNDDFTCCRAQHLRGCFTKDFALLLWRACRVSGCKDLGSQDLSAGPKMTTVAGCLQRWRQVRPY